MKKFFDEHRKYFGKIKASQVEPLQKLGYLVLNDHRLTIPQKAYVMATVKHETANTFKPIKEYGRGRGRRYGRPDPYTGHTYYGRGYVQLTWKANYITMGNALGVDLVNNPDLALDPEISYEVLVFGMIKGSFTGKSLTDYINDRNKDYRGARRIVNGMDRASLIASYAEKYERIFDSVSAEDIIQEPVKDKEKPVEKELTWGQILILLIKKLYNLLKGKGGKR